MVHGIDRRATLKGLAGLGIVSTLSIDQLSGCKQQAEHTPLTIISNPSPQIATLQALMSEGHYFDNVGLRPTIVTSQHETDVIDALLGGAADICMFGAFNQLLVAIERGAEIKILGGTSIKGKQALFSKYQDIKYVRDLEGRSIGSGAVGTQSHHVITALLRSKDIDIGAVKFVTLDGGDDALHAVQDGIIDAGNGPTDTLSSRDDLGLHLLKDGDYTFQLPEYTWQVAFAGSRTIRNKREALMRALAAYSKAFRYVQSPRSKREFVKGHLTASGERDMQHAKDDAISRWNYLQERRIYAEDLLLSPQRVQYMQALNIELGLQKTILPYEQLIDTSLAAEALMRFS